METVKNIGAVIGLILSLTSVFTLFSKTAKSFLASVFKQYGNNEEMSEIKTQLGKLTDLLEKHIEEEREYREQQKIDMDISLEFARTQCRNVIVSIFYKYYSTKILPLYEYKTLLKVEDLYIVRLKGNSFAGDLLKEMKTWEVNYTQTHLGEE